MKGMPMEVALKRQLDHLSDAGFDDAQECTSLTYVADFGSLSDFRSLITLAFLQRLLGPMGVD
jgi:hypothetical protein